MFDDFLLPIDLKKEEVDCLGHSSIDISKVFVDQVVDDIINREKQLKFECKILPYDERKSGAELFKCPLCCLENIEGRKALTEHLHHHQLQYKPCEGKHLCCLCDKELSSNSSLERHLLTHSNHRPFDCHLCGKKFTTNGNLSRHIKASHPTESCNDSSSQMPSTVTLDQNSSLPSSPPRTPLPSIIAPTLLANTPGLNHWQLPNINLQSTNDAFLKILENSLKAYKTALYCETKEEILNLSKKSNPASDFSGCPSSGSFHGQVPKDEISTTSCKRMAMKISQKYRGRRHNVAPKPYYSPLPYNDGPLDLSVRREPSPIISQEHNSFLSQSPDVISVTTIKVDTSNDFNSSSRHKKNSYKDAPKLIRCPMLGCTQKFPWNSSLMRHILTHTAHKPFRCIRCSKCFSTKSNRERHMHRVHGIRVNRLLIRSTISPDSSPCALKEEPDLMEMYDKDGFLSEKEWLEMSSSDRKAEDISHTLLKQAGEPVIEPNPYRQHLQMKMLLKIT